MPVLDQVGRAFAQFDIVLALIATPIDLVLAASGISPPGPLAAAYLNPHAFMAIKTSGAALAAMLVFGYGIFTFLVNLFAGVASIMAAVGAAAANAFGAPSLYAAAAAVGAAAQGLADFYLIIWLINLMSQSPFFNAVP